VGLDDFAFCKGHTYGTLICDLESKAPLALLPDRLPETVTAWLKKYPYIEVVSRDGFTGFRKGITDASSSIFQIYDRWHFIRNAKFKLDSFLSTIVPASITWRDGELPAKEIPLTRAEQIIKKRRNKKWELILEIQQAHDKCKNISRLAREYKLHRRTIRQYIKMKEPPTKHRHYSKPADQYRDKVITLEQEGNTVKEIYSKLRDQGYVGTYSAIRRMVEQFRKERKYNLSKENNFQVSRKKLGSWIWKPEKELGKEDRNSLDKCIELYPPLKVIYNTIQTYRKSIQMKDVETFLQWIKEQLSNKKNPFYQYAFKLRSDIQVVRNALLSPYSNGLLEGQINRLKMIKRMTYGRAKLKVLEKRVLYRL
jgi:transposase